MYKQTMLLLLTVTLAAGCSSRHTTPTINNEVISDASCTLFSPIYTHNQDAQLMDIRTVRQINTHNDLWVSLCVNKK